MNRCARLLAIPTVAAILSACAVANPSASAEPTTATPSATTPELSPSPEVPSPSASPDPTPSPDPGDASGIAPWNEKSRYAAFGTVATVLVDRLRVRQGAGLAQPPTPSHVGEGDEILSKGTRLLLTGGPMDVDGYRWYLVEWDGGLQGYMEVGWVAGAKVGAGGDPRDGDRLIGLGPTQCPDPGSFRAVRVMTEWAMDACGAHLTTVRGMFDTCYEWGMTPWTHSPEWAGVTCWFVRDETADWLSSRWSYAVYFPPELEDQRPERGDVVVLTGTLGVDESRYGRCTVSTEYTDEPSLEQMLPNEQFSFAQSCRHKFVVSGVTVKRHVDLPPLF